MPMDVADFVLPLLLAFRTNMVYQRWWDGMQPLQPLEEAAKHAHMHPCQVSGI